MADRGRNSAREPLALALARGQAVRAACAELNLSERTAYRWLAEASFKARIADLRREMIQAALGKLSDAMGPAVDRLTDLLLAQPSAAVSAAKAILEYALKLREQADLEERIAKLEQAALEQANHGKPYPQPGSPPSIVPFEG